MSGAFEGLESGRVIPLGVTAVDARALAAFAEAFGAAPAGETGAPDAMVFALWSKLDAEAAAARPAGKRVGVDAVRFVRSPPAGELLRGRMTVMAVDPVGEGRALVIAQHDLLDEAGRLVFSCLTRSIVGR
ncbi:MAG: acyl dehydratase [Caulobacteraceae bacterium]|nr:acyl dehydratase [Caulobacteraceae bacterium]